MPNNAVCTPNTLYRLFDWAREHRLREGRVLPICIWGERGMGKTQVVCDYARQRGLEMRIYHPAHDGGSGDLVGERWRDTDINATVYSPPRFLPTSGDHAVINPDGILLIDELNRADEGVLNGLFELIGDGRISQSNYTLPAGWQVVCCCNPPSADYNVSHLDPAMIDRMLHVAFAFDPEGWTTWASRLGLEEDVVSFVRRHPESVYAPDEGGVPSGVTPIATPRALEYFATLYEPQMPEDLRSIIASGLLGNETAGLFDRTRSGAERALGAEAILAGRWRRYFPRWIANGRSDLLRDSLQALMASLRDQQRDPVIARELIDIRDALDDATRGPFLNAVRAHLPQWHALIIDIEDRQRREQLAAQQSVIDALRQMQGAASAADTDPGDNSHTE